MLSTIGAIFGILAGILIIVLYFYLIYWRSKSIAGIVEKDEEKTLESFRKSVDWRRWLLLLAAAILCAIYKLLESK